MTLRWSVYSEAVDNARDEETLNDCFADLIEDSLTRSPEFLNYLVDDLVKFGAEADVEGTDRDPLPYRNEGTDRAIDFTIGDASKIVGFESKRGDSLSHSQLEDELDKLEYNSHGREAILVAVTEEFREPGIVSMFSNQVRWTSWYRISQRTFDAEGLDETWNPTISRAQHMFHEFGYREGDDRETDELSARIEREKNHWADRFVGEYKPESWSPEWTAKSRSGHIFKEGWRMDKNLEPTTHKAPIALQFVHHLRDENLISQGRLKFQFRWDGGSKADTKARDRFAAWFERELQESDLDIGSHEIDLGRGDYVFTEKIYEFDVGRFPTSYYETLANAFEEHQILVDFLEERAEVAEIVGKMS